MLTVIIGHRGSGKTNTVNRLKQLQGLLCFDLDQEIERSTGQSVSQIFIDQGEDCFRSLEERTLLSLVEAHKGQNIYVALGAGYIGHIPEGARIVWLKNQTDKDGRVFLNRPRLLQGESAWDEYLIKYKERTPKYFSIAHEQCILANVYSELTLADQLLFTEIKAQIGGCLTLLPRDFKTDFNKFITRRLGWGIDYFEIRQDLLSEDQQDLALSIIPQKNIIFSYRDKDKFKKVDTLTDWALELGEPRQKVDIVSLHQRKPTVEQSLDYINQIAGHKKLAIQIYNMDELMDCHEWYLKDPQNRSFLPSSTSGKWNWYRQLHKNKMKINYLRESEGSSLDQPLFYDWVNSSDQINAFGAIIGSPIYHSRTPLEQKDFFKSKNLDVLGLDLDEEDMNSGLLPQLAALGLRCAAVTSPVKSDVFHKTEFQDDTLFHLESANTIYYSKNLKMFLSTNTDVFGLKEMLKDFDPKTISVWGGGGTRTSLMYVLPEAAQYSMREASPVYLENNDPKVVVWAVGRKRHKNFPPQEWKPETVVDLNYSDDSPGKEYAVKIGAKYVSGEIMFKAQAQKQREFWTKQFVADIPK